MRYSAYAAKPDRYNPEFIGIANRYGQHKLQRKISESNNKELETDFLFNQKEDARLRKVIEAKVRELNRLRQAKRRHEAQLQEKQRRRQWEPAQLQALKCDNGSRRDKSRRNRKQAKQKLLQNNRSKKMFVDELKNTLTQQCLSMTQSRLRENRERYQTVKRDQEHGRMKVDAYHRYRNLSSLNDYKKRINAEVSLQKRHRKAAEQHQEGIKKLSESVNLKKALLEDIQGEIDKYRTNYRSVMRSDLWSREDDLFESRVFLSSEELKI